MCQVCWCTEQVVGGAAPGCERTRSKQVSRQRAERCCLALAPQRLGCVLLWAPSVSGSDHKARLGPGCCVWTSVSCCPVFSRGTPELCWRPPRKQVLCPGCQRPPLGTSWETQHWRDPAHLVGGNTEPGPKDSSGRSLGLCANCPVSVLILPSQGRPPRAARPLYTGATSYVLREGQR